MEFRICHFKRENVLTPGRVPVFLSPFERGFTICNGDSEVFSKCPCPSGVHGNPDIRSCVKVTEVAFQRELNEALRKKIKNAYLTIFFGSENEKLYHVALALTLQFG